ncbi:unnamed protein product [Ilex paraguariensis]|uniref:Uncharacterized protein n=1 Tax=Ilex paraguariensis TaxID=185542 RepID=A0ABC8RYB0_9AQUA
MTMSCSTTIWKITTPRKAVPREKKWDWRHRSGERCHGTGNSNPGVTDGAHGTTIIVLGEASNDCMGEEVRRMRRLHTEEKSGGASRRGIGWVTPRTRVAEC